MAIIQTTLREIIVKEDVSEVAKKIQNFDWIKVIENRSYFDHHSHKMLEDEREIDINTMYIVEIR